MTTPPAPGPGPASRPRLHQRMVESFMGGWHRLAGVPHSAVMLWQRMERRGHHRHPVARATGRWGAMLLVSAVGAILGILLGGTAATRLGPFHAHLSLRPTLSGGTEVQIPPLGALDLRTHAGPVKLHVDLRSLDEDRARQLVNDPDGIDKASDRVVYDLAAGVRVVAMHAAGAALLGAMVLGGLVYRSARQAAVSGCTAIAMMTAAGLIIPLTFRPDAIQEPRYRGLLTNAPAVVGDAREIADQFDEYRAQLQRLVQNVSRLYGTVSTLPVYEPDTRTTRVLHISDLHLNPAAWSIVNTVVHQFSIDVVIDTGDITDWGSEPEAPYVESIGKLGVPYLYIRGNHDSVNTAIAVSKQPNATVLDASVASVAGLTFAGIGDPRFTPDKSTMGAGADRELVRQSGSTLAGRIRTSEVAVDVALVHDPIAADPVAFAAPVILAGHTHKRVVQRLDGPNGSAATGRSLIMVQGSTGGAGLRGLEQAQPLSLALSVLYFDDSRLLKAYDDITVGGTGLTQVALERHLVVPDEPGSGRPSAGSGSSGASPTGPSTGPSGPGGSPPVPSGSSLVSPGPGG